MKSNSMLINFNVPFQTRKRFDEVCRVSGRTRTSVLVELMENFVLLQSEALEERAKKFKQLDHSILKNRQILGFKDALGNQSANGRRSTQTVLKSDFELPNPMMSNGQEDW